MATANTSTGKLIETLNELNLPPKTFTEINLELDSPSPIDGEAAGRTRLLVKSVPGRGYYNDVQITYNRINLPDAITADADIRSINDFTVDSIIGLINNSFGLFLTADDLDDFTPPTLGQDESTTLIISAKAGSRGFVGSVEITLTHARTPLDVIVALKLLPVRKHIVDPAGNKLSARMLTWGKDFTSVRDAIAINPETSSYVNWENLQVACQYLGIPGWTQGPIRDVTTSSVPDSNPAFARVVIQDDVVSDGMTGSIYLHYNLLDEV